MKFPDVIIAGDGTLLVPAIRSRATFIDSGGDLEPKWEITADGVVIADAAKINAQTGGYGSSFAEGTNMWLNGPPLGQSYFGAFHKAITEGAVNSGGVGFRALVVPN